MAGAYTNQPSIGRSVVRGGVMIVLFGPLFWFCYMTVKLLVYAVAWAVNVVVFATVYLAAFAAHVASAWNERWNRPAA